MITKGKSNRPKTQVAKAKSSAKAKPPAQTKTTGKATPAVKAAPASATAKAARGKAPVKTKVASAKASHALSMRPAAPKELAGGTAITSFPYSRIKQGVSGSDVGELLRTGRLRRADAELVIPPRTLNRSIKEGRALQMLEADAVARLLRVREHAERTFESRDLADQWLSSPNPELANELPIEMARTDVGAREVEAVLIRIQHGIVG